MKTVFKLILMAIAYLAIFILGAASGAIHPACYAYIGALLPLLSAFVSLTTATTIRSFGAATLLNGFILVLFLIAGEADTTFIIGIVALTALAELIWYDVDLPDTMDSVVVSSLPATKPKISTSFSAKEGFIDHLSTISCFKSDLSTIFPDMDFTYWSISF